MPFCFREPNRAYESPLPLSPEGLNEAAERAGHTETASGCQASAAEHLSHLEIALLLSSRLHGVSSTEVAAQPAKQGTAAAEAAKSTADSASASQLLVDPALGRAHVQTRNLIKIAARSAAAASHRAHLLLDPIFGATTVEAGDLVQALTQAGTKPATAATHLGHLLVNPRGITQTSTHSRSHSH